MFNLKQKESGFFDSIFDDFLPIRNQVMKTDIKEEENKYVFSVELPGITKEDVKVRVHQGYLTIAVETKEENEISNDRYIRKERYQGSISRQYYVGDVKTDDLSASFKDGILSIEVPKASKSEIKYLEIK